MGDIDLKTIGNTPKYLQEQLSNHTKIEEIFGEIDPVFILFVRHQTASRSSKIAPPWPPPTPGPWTSPPNSPPTTAAAS